MILIAFILLLRYQSSPFFLQVRPGKGGKLFTIFKFRTITHRTTDGMSVDEIDSFGKWLRHTSLDELPQLFNVLKGDMSLVGPRPLLVEYLNLYTPEQKIRHDLLPGMTGWAQVHGRNTISLEEKIELDIWYVKHYSFLVDMRILLKTFRLL